MRRTTGRRLRLVASSFVRSGSTSSATTLGSLFPETIHGEKGFPVYKGAPELILRNEKGLYSADLNEGIVFVWPAGNV